MTSSPAPTEAGFKGMFSAKRSLKPQPKPARRGDKHATLFELALRTIIASTDEACPHDATLEECFEVSECIAEWPAACFEWVLPRINPKLLMACGATGLVHLGGEGKGAEADEMPPDGRRDAGWALREAARPLIEGAIRREELRYRQSRDTAMRAAADGPPLDVFSLVDIFGEWGRFVGKSEPPSLPMRQLLFADERAARLPPLGSPVWEPSIDDFRANFDAFTGGILAGLDWSGIVAAGGAALACALHSPVPPASTSSAVDDAHELERHDARWRWFEPLDHSNYRRGCPAAYEGNKGTWEDDVRTSPFSSSSDVDLFLVGLTSAQALDAVTRIHRTIRRNHRGRVLLIKTGSSLTFVAGGHPQRFVQCVLKLFASVEDVLSAFDVDCCALAYDGIRLVGTLRALRACVTRVNTIDLDRRSVTYESRLLKYARRGFAIGVEPDLLDRRRIDPSLFEPPSILGNTSAHKGLARLLIASEFASAMTARLPKIWNSYWWDRDNALLSSKYPRVTGKEENGPIPFLKAWVSGWLGDRRRRRTVLPAMPGETVYDRGTNATTPDESFSIAEADEVGDASSPPSGRDPALRPALYSAGVVPWRVGWDTRRIEASLNNAQRSGYAYDDMIAEGDYAPPNGPAAGTPFTLTAQRSISSMVPSEHVSDWGYRLEGLLWESSFSMAERNASFFPVAPAGFNARCHITEPTTLTELVFTSASVRLTEAMRASPTSSYRWLDGLDAEKVVGEYLEVKIDGEWRRAVFLAKVPVPEPKPVIQKPGSYAPGVTRKYKLRLSGYTGEPQTQTSLAPAPDATPTLATPSTPVGGTTSGASSPDTVSTAEHAPSEHGDASEQPPVSPSEPDTPAAASADHPPLDPYAGDPSVVELDATKIRAISPLAVFVRKFSEAGLLPKGWGTETPGYWWAGLASTVTYATLCRLGDPETCPLIKTHGLVLRAALRPGEAQKAQAVIDELAADDALLSVCDPRSSLTLRSYAWPPEDGDPAADISSRDAHEGFLTGERVVIRGLTSQPKLNGLTGVVLGGIADGRYPVEVELLKGEWKRVRLKLQNLETASPEAA